MRNGTILYFPFHLHKSQPDAPEMSSGGEKMQQEAAGLFSCLREAKNHTDIMSSRKGTPTKRPAGENKSGCSLPSLALKKKENARRRENTPFSKIEPLTVVLS